MDIGRWDAVTRQCEGLAVIEALASQHVLHICTCYMSEYPTCSYIKFVLHCNLYYFDIEYSIFLIRYLHIESFEFSAHSREHLQLCDAGMVFYVAVTVGHPSHHVETKEPPWEVVSLTTSIMFHAFSIQTSWETFGDSGRDTSGIPSNCSGFQSTSRLDPAIWKISLHFRYSGSQTLEEY